MTQHELHGGPHDGLVVDVPDDRSTVVFTVLTSKVASRPLGEYPDIRLDPDSGVVIAPADLAEVFTVVCYDRVDDVFRLRGAA